MKGQGSTEYLVVFAMVLIVALLIIFILGGMGNQSTEALIKQSKTYWATARPIGVIEFQPSGDASGNINTLTFVFKNNEEKPVRIYEAIINGHKISVGATLGPQETYVWTTSASSLGLTGKPGELLEIELIITYYYRVGGTTTAWVREAGEVPLRGIVTQS